MAAPAPWWQAAVLYQIYPRSFLDTDGDGIGDLDGVRAKLDYLRWLGVDGIWLSPIYRSPMADFGYDVSDHCAVDPVFGDLAGFDRLLAGAHAHGLRLLLDWVPNHTSDRHPWFEESRSSRRSARRDWYVWRDGTGSGPPDGRPPNNWRAAFGGRAWTWDDRTAQWYLHLFLPQQPDLDWSTPAVVEAMHGVLRFWLDRGSTASGPTSCTSSARIRPCPTSRPSWPGATWSASTTTLAPIRCCGASAPCSTPTRATG
jgi:alpha-glucosidase